jgi:hypothetical protein
MHNVQHPDQCFSNLTCLVSLFRAAEYPKLHSQKHHCDFEVRATVSAAARLSSGYSSQAGALSKYRSLQQG